MYMSFDDLSKDQILQLKQRYLFDLADEGCFNEVIYDRPEDDDDPGLMAPSMEEVANADDLVPDDLIREKYGETAFTEEDFS